MAEIQRKNKKSTGTIMKDAVMTGISYMIPVIVGGGVITALAKLMGGYNIGADAANMENLAQVIYTIGNNLFCFHRSGKHAHCVARRDTRLIGNGICNKCRQTGNRKTE